MILKADGENLARAAALACELWSDNTPDGLLAELEALDPEESVIFLDVEEGVPAGFAQCQLRHDYVEGTHSSPVGYLEGIYVREEYRGQGIARTLLRACEGWAEEQGCAEFASDCELDNVGSIAFHLGSGFAEANRIVCFTKRLGEEA
ncbi:MAG: GNAT family N-acetyltransferase [Oscillospiraceae bacterium]|nr:GNAT family N-acetyltransferase [Oscillospiraceae bacterium]MDE7171964.1 GNAT family N-acetyltransferase [Oscillospiraceae bacterium]